MKKFTLLSLAVLLAACSTTTGTSTPQQSAQVVNEDGEKLICKGEERTGTRIPRDPVCRTESEWEAIATREGDTIDRLRNRTGSEGSLSVD